MRYVATRCRRSKPRASSSWGATPPASEWRSSSSTTTPSTSARLTAFFLDQSGRSNAVEKVLSVRCVGQAASTTRRCSPDQAAPRRPSSVRTTPATVSCAARELRLTAVVDGQVCCSPLPASWRNGSPRTKQRRSSLWRTLSPKNTEPGWWRAVGMVGGCSAVVAGRHMHCVSATPTGFISAFADEP